MGKLTVAGVRAAKPGRHADGDGLYLLVKPTGARSWLLRIQADGRRRDVGLGTADLTARSSEHLSIAAKVRILMWQLSSSAFQAAGFTTGSKAKPTDKAAQTSFMNRMVSEAAAYEQVHGKPA